MREVAADVKAELLGARGGRALEKPSLGIIVEGVRLMSPDGWQGRLGLSKGLGPVSAGFSAGFQRAGGETSPLVGIELSLRVTPIGRQRTPVFDLFTRVEVAFEDGQRRVATLVGLRALLNLL